MKQLSEHRFFRRYWHQLVATIRSVMHPKAKASATVIDVMDVAHTADVELLVIHDHEQTSTHRSLDRHQFLS